MHLRTIAFIAIFLLATACRGEAEGFVNGGFEKFDTTQQRPPDASLKIYKEGFSFAQGSSGAFEGDSFLKIILTGGSFSMGFPRSYATLEPGKHYRLSLRYQKIPQPGKAIPGFSVKIAATSQNQWRTWIVTPAEESREWKKAEILFLIPTDAKKPGISFYFNGDGEIFLDAISLVEEIPEIKGKREVFHGIEYVEAPYVPKHPVPQSSKEDNDAGYIPFVPVEQDGLRPNYRPSAAECGSALELFSARGCALPGTFALYPLKELKDLKVSIGPLLQDGGSGVLDTELISFRHVKTWPQRTGYRSYEYYVIPELLETFDSLSASPGTISQFWCTFNIPKTCAPGNYRGVITITGSGIPTRTIPVRINVLPFALVEHPSNVWGLYTDAGRWKKWKKENIVKEVRDMRRHGINSFILYPLGFVEFTFTNKILSLNFSRWKEMLKIYVSEGIQGPFVCNLQSLSGHLNRILGRTETVYDAEMERYFKQTLREIEEMRREAGFPAFLYHVVDEPSELSKNALTELKWTKELGLPTFSTITYRAGVGLFDLLDYFCFAGLPTSDEELKSMLSLTAKKEKHAWWYGIGAYSGQEIAMLPNRAGAGFLHWKSGYDAVWAWTFQRVKGDPFDDFDSAKKACITYPLPGKEESIPTLAWEGIREGYYDFNYAHTLSHYLSLCENSNASGAKETAAEVRSALEIFKNAIPWKSSELSNADLTKYRWFFAQMISRLLQKLEKDSTPTESVKAEDTSAMRAEFSKLPSSTRIPLQNYSFLAKVPFSIERPVIDGDLSDSVWKRAAGLHLSGVYGTEPKKSTEAMLLHDEEFLYIGVRCEEPDIAFLSSKRTARDSDVYEEDCIEFFFDPRHDHNRYFHIAINAKGTIYDAENIVNREKVNTPIAGISADLGVSAAGFVGKDFWSLEVVFPLAKITADRDFLGFNIAREAYARPKGAPMEITSWAPTHGPFHNTIIRFGHLLFEKKDLHVTWIGLKEEPLFGPNACVLRLENPSSRTVVITAHARGTREASKKSLTLSPKTGGEIELPLGILLPGVHDFLIECLSANSPRPFFTAAFPVEIPESITTSAPGIVLFPNNDSLNVEFEFAVQESLRREASIHATVEPFRGGPAIATFSETLFLPERLHCSISKIPAHRDGMILKTRITFPGGLSCDGTAVPFWMCGNW